MIEGLVRAEGGRLVIESSEGVGTLIRMLFPVAAKIVRDPTWSDSRVRRVLVVEDHPLLRPMLGEALSHAGCEVDSCADGDAAMAAIVEFTPDILVVDVNLPGVRGDQVAQQLRERIGRQVPVLFITGNNDFDLPDWPSVRLIRKPFELPDFTKMVLGSLSN
jgi:CheY-like chemotaxis protein